MTTRRLLGTVLVAACMAVTACNNSDRDLDDTTIASAENATAENLFNEAWKTVHEVILEDTVLNLTDTTRPPEACIDSIRRYPDLGPYPIRTEIFYGVGDMCANGQERRGKILFELSGPYRSQGTQLKITFDGFFINAYQLSGEILIVTDTNQAGLPTFRKTVTNGRALRDFPGNARFDAIYSADQQVIWGVGADTPENVWDDEFRITGTTAGRNTKGVFFTTVITDQIIARPQCSWELSGQYTLDLENLATRYVDLGGGTCDNRLSVRIHNSDYEVRMSD